MERIGPAIERELRRFGGHGAMPRIVACWPRVVGDTVSRHSWPARVSRDGTLLVHTTSSVWAFELGQLAPSILDRLAADLGGEAPQALRFVQGHVPEPALPAPARAQKRLVPVSAEAAEAAEALTASIEDPELRERVARAAARALSCSPDGRSI